MIPVLSLTPFQLLFVGGFLVLACALALILRTRKLPSFAVILVVAVLLMHYMAPLAQFVTSIAH